MLFEPTPDLLSYPSFAFVRDPVDRVYSAWKDFRYLRRATDLSFVDFVKHYTRPSIEDAIADPRTIEHHVAPMTHAVHGLQYAKFVGRFDHLQDDYDRFRRTVDLPPKSLDRLRNTDCVQVDVSQTDRRLVEDAYSADYAMLESMQC